MGVLRVNVLGRPEVVHDGARVELSSTKTVALVCYLAITGQRHSRSELAGLLWGDLPDDRARANLRLVLSGLRRSLPKHIDISDRDVSPGAGWVVDLDELSQALANGFPDAPQRARGLIRGDLLAGLDLPGAPGFADWLLAERARVRRTTIDGLAELARKTAERDPDEALALARELVSLDPLDEAGHRLVMQLLAATGRRAAGLAQYETCRHVLSDELGVDPSPETTALRDQMLRADREEHIDLPPGAGRPAESPIEASALSRTRKPLPDGALPLIGRERELERITALLTDDTCRLLTLVGPGGVGKTRLAAAAAGALSSGFADGVEFVSLAAAPAGAAPADVAGAVLTALDAPSSKDSPIAALRRTLAGRQLLLILDTVEHLDVADLLAELLGDLPALTVLATSRRRIGLGVEWLIDVGGLPCPDGVDPDLERFPAVTLFATRARRVRPGFAVAEDPAAVVRICQLVEGLPLALELAADWMRSLQPGHVAKLIASDLDALATEHGVVEARQRSMRSVLESSWQLLDDHQQRKLARLSMFHGEFDADAAMAVAGASVTDLGRLADRCMVQRQENGRFDLHELLRQFAAERLAAQADEPDATRERHAAHYAAVAADHLPQPGQGLEPAAAQKLEPDLANLRSAAAWLIEHGNEGSLAAIVASLWLFDESRTRFREALTLLEAALARRSTSPSVAAVWHRWAGTAAFELGQMERASSEFQAALAAGGQPLPGTAGAQIAAVCRAITRLALSRLGLRRKRTADPDSSERLLALVMLGRTMYFLQRPVPLALAILLVASEADRAADRAATSLARAELSHLATIGRRRGLARRYGRLFDEEAGGRPDSEAELLALESRALTQVAAAEWEGAQAAITRALDGADRLGFEHCRIEFTATAAIQPLFQGRFGPAKDMFEVSLAHARRLGDEYGFLWCAAGLTEARLWLGADPGELAPLQAEAAERSAGLPAPERMKGRAVLATVRLAEGQPDEALRWVRAATAAAREARLIPVWALDGYGHCAQAWLALWSLAGDQPSREVVHGARDACRQLQRYARAYAIGVPRHHWAAGWLAWLQGRQRRARAEWRRSLAAAEQLRMSFDAARAHAALAQGAEDADARRHHHDRARVIAGEAGFAADRLGLRPTNTQLTLT